MGDRAESFNLLEDGHADFEVFFSYDHVTFGGDGVVCLMFLFLNFSFIEVYECVTLM